MSDIRAAIAGEPRDYTTGSVGRAILLLAVPMVLEMSMQSLFGVVDVYFVGRIGSDAVAVVGITDSLLALVFAVAIGLAMGTTAMVARRIGEGEPERASSAAVQAIALGLVCSVPLGLIGWLFAPELLEAMGASPEVAREGAIFTAIILGTNVTIMLLFLINAVFRGAGDPALAMRALWIANLLNIALDPLLIFGWGPIPAMGLTGAAIATAGSRAIGVVYQLVKLSDRRSRIRIDWRRVRVDPPVMIRLARVSAIGILQYLISTASFLVLVRIVALAGDRALAGYTIAVRVIIFILLPAWGMANAAATLVGQNLGARNPTRAERSVVLTSRCNAVFLGFVSLVLLVFGGPIVSIFTSEPEVVDIAASALRIISYSYVFWGFGVTSLMAFNGAGDTTTPTWVNFFVFWVCQLPMAWYLTVPGGFGPQGVFISITIAQLLLAIAGVWLFRIGSWKVRSI